MVDDEPDITLSLKTALEENGFFQVDAFNDSESAISKFRSGVYDLALLDIRMPNMDGFQLYRKIMEIDNKIKICFLTAADLSEYGVRESDIIDDLGTDCFINKPVKSEDITERLKIMLSCETNKEIKDA
jgi:DNA-binding response OmpR family regulator